MSLGVFGEMVAAHELVIAEWANVLLLSCVRPSVSCKFVRPCKSPIAIVPGTDVRFFPRVRSHVCLQMRVLKIHLRTRTHRTDERSGTLVCLVARTRNRGRNRLRRVHNRSVRFVVVVFGTTTGHGRENGDDGNSVGLEEMCYHIVVCLREYDHFSRREGSSVERQGRILLTVY